MNIVVLLDTIASILHIISGLLISGKGLSNGRVDKREILTASGVTAVFVPLLMLVDMNVNKVAVLFCVEGAFILLCSVYFRKVDKRMGLFVSIIFEISIRLLTLLLGASFILYFNDKDFIDLFTLHGAAINVIAGVIAFGFSAAAFFIKKLSSKIWLRIGAYLGIATTFYINYLETFDIKELDKEEINSWLYYSIVIICGIFVVQMRRQYETEKELAELKADEAMILERQYRTLSNSYESNAKLFHDFRNHCGILKNYLTKGKSDEALTYLEELTGTGSSLEVGFWTGDETVDYLIGSKKNLAEEKGISFEAEVEFPHNTNIKSSDLCAILGNLIDNAIEASAKVTRTDARRVHLIIRRIQQMLVIKVENTFEDKPVTVDGDFKTSKNDGGLHGWGIKSARTAAEKYDGMVQSSIQGDLFTAVVTLSF